MISDIQHDLALMMTSPEDLEDLIEEYTQMLIDKGASIPTNVRFEHDIFARGKRKLVYDLLPVQKGDDNV